MYARPDRPQPENHHVKFNVDVKVQNNPARLFSLMHTIVSSHEGWQALLAPRILLGLWHPTFLPYAQEHLPYCRRSYIGEDTGLARKYFWKDVDAFSMWFGCLTTADGEKYVPSKLCLGLLLTVCAGSERIARLQARSLWCGP